MSGRLLSLYLLSPVPFESAEMLTPPGLRSSDSILLDVNRYFIHEERRVDVILGRILKFNKDKVILNLIAWYFE